MEREELELFRRGLAHATGTSGGADLDAALADLGWHEALDADERAAVSLLFELQGRAATTSSALDLVVARALGVGEADAAVVLPPLGTATPPGAVFREGVAVLGLGTSTLARRDRALVVTGTGDEDGHLVGVVATGELALRPVGGLDPALGLIEVTGDRLGAATQPAGPWAAAVAAGRLALAHELVGVSRAMLELARAHALDRVQFGVPIASFQAVRHRLAETLVAIEGAEAAAGAAWDDGSPLGATLAKAVAGRAARTAARHCQQVLAGIGFTTEHALHRYVRRALVLDHLLGDARSLAQELGTDLLRDRRLPAILPL